MMIRQEGAHKRTARMSAFACMALMFGALALMSHHNGVAEQQNKDRTGAPGSQQPCTACHSNGSYNVTPFIAVYAFEGSNDPLSEYIPGTEYYVEFTVNA